MPSFKEIIRETKVAAAKIAFEHLIRPVRLKEAESASLQHAYELNGSNRWEEAAQEFYTLFTSSEVTRERADGLVGLSQILINLGRLGQARRFLERGELQLLALPQRERSYYEARIYEKQGWICDYEGDFTQSASYFTKARTLVSQQERTEEEESLFSTTTHFLGRAHIGMAFQGKDSLNNAQRAVEYFQEDLRRYERLREEGRPIPAGEAFQHAWLGVCYLSANEVAKAEEEIEMAGGLFREAGGDNFEKSGGAAHYYNLKGGLALKRWLINEARSEFEKALKIWQAVGYPKGKADSASGIAATFWAEGNKSQGSLWFARSVKMHPYVLLRAKTFLA